MRLSGSPLLVTGLAKQAPRPKRIGPLTLPLASFGDPLIAGVGPLEKNKSASECCSLFVRYNVSLIGQHSSLEAL